jgi:MerR family transcriptional regulator/heat shock protein HspR
LFHEKASEPLFGGVWTVIQAGRVLTMVLLGHMKVSVASGNRPVYVISIAASIAGCHPRTLRIYEEEGLLEPVRTDTNIRLYSDEDLQRVRVIRYLTQVRGVNLAGVRLLLQFHDVADLLEELANALDQNGDGSADPKPTTF